MDENKYLNIRHFYRSILLRIYKYSKVDYEMIAKIEEIELKDLQMRVFAKHCVI